MKCSHGLPYEVKCMGCFEDAMKRVSASEAAKSRVVPMSEVLEWAAGEYCLGDIQVGVDTNPRHQ